MAHFDADPGPRQVVLWKLHGSCSFLPVVPADLPREAARRAPVVAVVGVTPAPEDRHVWDPIAATPGRVLYVGRADPFESWTREHRGGRPATYLGDRFDTAVPAIVDAIDTR